MDVLEALFFFICPAYQIEFFCSAPAFDLDFPFHRGAPCRIVFGIQNFFRFMGQGIVSATPFLMLVEPPF